MAIFKSAIVIFAIVVSLFSLMAKGELITKCIVAYAQECPDQESSAGIEKCCSLMVNLYKNDADCLCSIFEYTTTDDEAANKKLSNCSITTQVPFSCNFNRERILEGSVGSPLAGAPFSASSPSSIESPSPAKIPEADESAGYKNTINGISGIMSLAFLSFFIAFIVA